MYKYLLLVALITACSQGKKPDSVKSPSSNKNQSVSVKYFPNGDLYVVESYQEGKLNGPVVGFFNNKRVSISGHYKNGRRQGTWMFFTQEGKIRRRIEFRDDKAITSWTDSTLVVE